MNYRAIKSPKLSILLSFYLNLYLNVSSCEVLSIHNKLQSICDILNQGYIFSITLQITGLEITSECYKLIKINKIKFVIANSNSKN